jgi:exopolysaccharide production protein ExoQ
VRISKSRFISPGDNFHFGVFAVSLSIVVFAYSRLFGSVAILVFYAVWLPLILLDYRSALGNYARFLWIIAFSSFAALSVIWSAASGVTIRASTQYLTTIACALIASRTIDARTALSGSSTGVAVVLLCSLAFGTSHYDTLDGSYTFVGLFSSKNQLGFFASLGVYMAFASLLIFRLSMAWRCTQVFLGALSVYCLIASSSATSIGATAATLGITGALAVVLRLAPHNRRSIFPIGLVVGLVIAVVALNYGAIELVLQAFGKNSTLTGRTYLWQEGLRAAEDAPLVGIGYQAYWVQGFAEAERLWDEFYVTSRTGFHFHNTYVEVLVELGYIGLVLMSGLIAAVLIGNLKQILMEARGVQAHFMFGIAILLVIRSFFEVDFIQPYTIGSFLLYYSAGVLAIRQRALYQ